MSPTVFRAGGLRFFFFSREELRMHIHAIGPKGEAKFWIEPQIQLARNYGLSDASVRKAVRLIEERKDEIRAAWRSHFGS